MLQVMPGGGLIVKYMTVRNMITLAYGVDDDKLSGAPKWMGAEYYDVTAKPTAGGTSAFVPQLTDDMKLRIQYMLADRCQLKVHRETRMAPVYALTVAKTGIRMREAMPETRSGAAGGTILPLGMLVGELSRRVHRPVIDQTGLKGAGVVKLEYSTEGRRYSGGHRD